MSTVFNIDAAQLTGVGTLRADPSWTFASHAHDFWEFVYFIQGCGRIQLPHATLRPQQYHLAVFPPGLPHAESSDPRDPEETIFFGVEASGATAPPAGAHLLLPDPQGHIRWLCERILAECSTYGGSYLANTYLHAFLVLVERMWESGLPVQHDMVDLAVQYMRANYAQSLTMTGLAEVASISEAHLAHRFRARMGISPMRYLQQVRLEAAKRMLLTTDLPVKEIALQTGFNDPLYLSRSLHRATGLSPTQLRQNGHDSTASSISTAE
jgi:AraC-like DNA-binding protein